MSRVKLGDVAEEVRETYQGTMENPAIVGLEHLIPGEFRLKNWDSESDSNTTFTKAFHKGQVLFGRRRAYLKKAAVAPVDGVCSGDITVISAKQDKILPELLPFVIQNDDFFEYAVGNSAGSLSPRVKWDRLREYEFNLPDRDSQKKLATLLWNFVDTKEAYQDLIQQTDELVKSQFIEMFGDPYEVIQNSNARISDVAKVQVGIVIKPTRFYASDDKGIRAFRSLNVSPFHVKDDSEWVYFSQDGMEKNKRTIAHVGDVLVVRSGAPGTSCVVDEKHDGCNVIDLIIAHPQKSKVLPEYLCAFTNFPHGKLQIEGQSRGVAQKHFNVSMYENMRIIVPPMEQQQKFVDFLSQSDKSKFVTCTINKLIEGMTLCLRKTIQLSR